MSGLSRGIPADRKEAVLFAADNADDMLLVRDGVTAYREQGHHDMAEWTSNAYLFLCVVDFVFQESRWKA